MTTKNEGAAGRMVRFYMGTVFGSLAVTIDRRLETHGMGLFYSPRSIRPWWHFALLRDPSALGRTPGWELQVGKWELMRDARDSTRRPSLLTHRR